MGKITKQMTAEIEALERGDAAVTESPLGDRGEPRPPASREAMKKLNQFIKKLTARERAAIETGAQKKIAALRLQQARQVALAHVVLAKRAKRASPKAVLSILDRVKSREVVHAGDRIGRPARRRSPVK